MDEARTYPPSEQRILEARRAGHVPRTGLVAMAAQALGLTIALTYLGDSLWSALAQLLAQSLTALTLAPPPAAFIARIAPAFGTSLFLLLALVWALAMLAQLLAQGFAVRWPFTRSRRPFAPLRPARGPRLLAAILVLGFSLVLLPEVLRVTPHTAGGLLARGSLRVSMLLVACALVDVFLARAAFFRTLWLTRREHQDELREAYGAPEMRAERERIRRAHGGAEAL
jgi:flagellar biosynthesis protein FlhB